MQRETSRKADLVRDPVLATVHDVAFLADLTKWCRDSVEAIAKTGLELPSTVSATDLYLCPESLGALQGSIGAVYDAVDHVCAGNVRSAFAAIRPPGHHAACGVPSGFCWLNNVVCGAVYAAQAHGIRHVAIIDIDLHHGDGTQAIVKALSNPAIVAASPAPGRVRPPRIFYGSIHDILSYPTEVYDEARVREHQRRRPPPPRALRPGARTLKGIPIHARLHKAGARPSVAPPPPRPRDNRSPDARTRSSRRPHAS